MDCDSTPVQQLVAKAGSLYSLPTVAMEVVRLAEKPQVDAEELKQTLEQDPALTVRLLRVVNSSLFGLSGKVSNLTQAIALLGIRPLKMLVLGFTLPDRLFADMASAPLRRFWTSTLTRAVAARAIAEHFYKEPEEGAAAVQGDDAFIAALLQEVGVLVLLQELGEPYLCFLEEANRELTARGDRQRCCFGDVRELEHESLGFDHRDLTAELLRHWRLPAALPEAILAADEADRLTAARDPHRRLPQILRLAELTASLVGNRRLDLLPELLRSGDLYCGLTKPALTEIVGPLQTQVDALAEVLSVALEEDRDYEQVLVDAQKQFAAIPLQSDRVDQESLAAEEELMRGMLVESHELRLAMRQFLGVAPMERASTTSEGETAETELLRPEGAHLSAEATADPGGRPSCDRVLPIIQQIVEHCRRERYELSLMLMASNRRVPREDPTWVEAWEEAQVYLEPVQPLFLPLSTQWALVLAPQAGRQDTTRFAQTLIRSFRKMTPIEPPSILWAGIASISQISNRFDPQKLIDAAEGCLSAARHNGAAVVKSIEVY